MNYFDQRFHLLPTLFTQLFVYRGTTNGCPILLQWAFREWQVEVASEGASPFPLQLRILSHF